MQPIFYSASSTRALCWWVAFCVHRTHMAIYTLPCINSTTPPKVSLGDGAFCAIAIHSNCHSTIQWPSYTNRSFYPHFPDSLHNFYDSRRKNGKKTEKSKISPPSFKNIPNECIWLRALNACDAVFAAAAQSSQQSIVCRLFVQRWMLGVYYCEWFSCCCCCSVGWSVAAAL